MFSGTIEAYLAVTLPIHVEVIKGVSACLLHEAQHRTAKSVVTYISLKGTATKTAYSVLRDKERFKNWTTFDKLPTQSHK